MTEETISQQPAAEKHVEFRSQANSEENTENDVVAEQKVQNNVNENSFSSSFGNSDGNFTEFVPGQMSWGAAEFVPGQSSWGGASGNVEEVKEFVPGASTHTFSSDHVTQEFVPGQSWGDQNNASDNNFAHNNNFAQQQEMSEAQQKLFEQQQKEFEKQQLQQQQELEKSLDAVMNPRVTVSRRGVRRYDVNWMREVREFAPPLPGQPYFTRPLAVGFRSSTVVPSGLNGEVCGFEYPLPVLHVFQNKRACQGTFFKTNFKIQLSNIFKNALYIVQCGLLFFA